MSRIPIRRATLAQTLLATAAIIGAVGLTQHHGAQPKTAAVQTHITDPAPFARPITLSLTQAQLADIKNQSAHLDELAKANEAKIAAQQAAARRAAAAAVAAERARQARASRSQARTPLSSGDPRSIARGMLAAHGWSSSQFSCLDPLWQRESGWNVHAENASSGAYGIPQALPGAKMSGAGPDWQDDAATQISWGLGYIAGRYGTPCGAWAHSQSTGWY